MLATALKRKEVEWIRKGREEGEHKKALKAAQRMLAKGIEPDEIAELLVIDRAEVLGLQAELKRIQQWGCGTIFRMCWRRAGTA
ncbi:MAG: hypothetical protein WCQ50_08175 [Spirochaetota bacterium]